ncbi:Hemoglobin subunit alpha-2 [Dissostichus eleginoides]|uniref:Hemoglobin subunit alpha-2 n=1 Tax=Dissostichus eleginoides TaxID=100907 RepID=A0AAD9BPU8_DISEL|nr:Hemoglobin subunit alpha-2 [Dissostichus eleginoides]
MDLEKKRHERNCQLVALAKWLNWVKLRKKTQAVASEKLERLVNAGRLKRIIAAWRNVLKDSKRTKEYYKRLEMGFIEIGNKVNQTEEGCDILSMLPSNLSLKIFRYLKLRDWLIVLRCVPDGKLSSSQAHCGVRSTSLWRRTG